MGTPIESTDELAKQKRVVYEDYPGIFKEEEIYKIKTLYGKKQKAAQSFAKFFVPQSNFGIWLRNFAFKMMSLPFVRN